MMAKAIITRQRNNSGVKARKLSQRTLGANVNQGRYILQNRGQAMRSAKQRALYQGRTGDYDESLGDYFEGINLKKGIMGMANKADSVLTDEQYEKLNRMDPQNLSSLYQNNRIVFDVAFNYGGISTDSETGADVVSYAKSAELQHVIDAYEAIYGEIAV